MSSLIKIGDKEAEVFKLPDWMNKEDVFLLHEGNASIDGHFYLDWDKGWSDGSFYTNWMKQNNQETTKTGGKLKGIIITGNLFVSGSIINSEGDFGPSLIVIGNCTAQSIIAGGSYIKIKENATIAEAVYGFYNHGELDIWGKITTPIFINEDHLISVGTNTFLREGEYNKKDLGCKYKYVSHELGDNAVDEDSIIPAKLRKMLSPRLMVWKDILATLCKGESILKKNEEQIPATIQEWVPFVWNNKAVLKKVPATLKNEDFYLALFADNAPIKDMDVREILAKIPKNVITHKIGIAAMQLSPKSLLHAPASFKLEELYEDCFMQVKNPQEVFEGIPEQYRTDKMRNYLSAKNLEEAVPNDIAEHVETLLKELHSYGEDRIAGFVKDGSNVLHLALGANNFDFCYYARYYKKLIEINVPVNAQDTDGNTPLHLAAKNGDVEGCRFLLNNGADVILQNKEGKIPFQVTKNREVKKLFKSKE